MSAIINQIDYLTSLAGTIIDADFIIVLFKKGENQYLMPISINNRAEIIDPKIEILEEKWCKRKIGKDQILSGLIALDSISAPVSKADKFSAIHNFKFMSQYPFYRGNSVEILTLAYWFEEPAFNEHRAELAFIQINNLLKIFMKSIEDNQTLNDYTLRVSDLIS